MRVLTLFILIILSSSLVYAQGSNTITEFIGNSSSGGTIAVLGDLSSDIDAYFTFNSGFYGNLNAYGQNDDYIELATPPGMPPVITNISELIATTPNVILIGGPCANNRFWGMFSPFTCGGWPFSSGQAYVEVIERGNQNILLISGTDREDTFTIINKMVENPGHTMFHQSMLNFTAPSKIIYNSQCQTTTDHCATLYIGSEIPFKSGNEVLNMKLKDISDDKSTIEFKLDGQQQTLSRGQTIVHKGVELTFDNVDYHLITGKAIKALLYSPQIIQSEFGFASPSGDSGTLQASLGHLFPEGLGFLQFHDGQTIKFVTKDISPNTVKIEINGQPQSMIVNDTVIVDGVTVTLQRIDPNMQVSDINPPGIAFFDYHR